MSKRISKYWQGQLDHQEMRALLKELDEKEIEISALNSPLFDLTEEEIAEPLPYDTELMLASIHLRTNKITLKPARRISQLYRWFAAACALFVLGFLFHYYIGSGNSGGKEVADKKWTYEQSNNSVQNIQLNLPDGSSVSLSPNSSIRYRFEEKTHRRMVALVGGAVFVVHKDPNAPFTVFNNGFETTALGTAFSVDDKKRKNFVEIHLLEGKVVVKNTTKGSFNIKDTYLNPGDRLKLDLQVRSATLERYQAKEKRERSKPQSLRVITSRLKDKGKTDDLNFIQTSLAEVFERVGQARNILIVFSEEDIAGLTFTGNLNNITNIHVLLNGICATNQLTFKYENNKYTIVKTD